MNLKIKKVEILIFPCFILQDLSLYLLFFSQDYYVFIHIPL